MASSQSLAGRTPSKDFRSWGETQIARMLNRYEIPYLYEHPVAVVDQDKTRIWYPDFQLCGYGIILEYCGRPDDPAYAEGMAKKRAVYAANGLTALMFTPDLFRGNWPATVLDEIEKVQTDRLAAVRAVTYSPNCSGGRGTGTDGVRPIMPAS